MPDAVLVVPEADYCYGVGTLTLRVTAVGADPQSFRRLEWVRIDGHEIYWNGRESAAPRSVMVRVSAIGEALRPVGWRPAQDQAR